MIFNKGYFLTQCLNKHNYFLSIDLQRHSERFIEVGKQTHH